MTETSGHDAQQERVASLEARVEELLQTVAVLATQVAALQHAGASPAGRPVGGPARRPNPAPPETSAVPAPVPVADDAVADEPAGIGRRRMLLGGGAAGTMAQVPART